jgi:hypothetical protein
MSYDALAQNAIDLLEAILDEQLEHEPEASHQLASGLHQLANDALENRLMPAHDALALMAKCYTARWGYPDPLGGVRLARDY